MPPERNQSAPRDADRLRHMLAAAEDATRFAEGRRREDLDTDPMLRRAVIQAVQEIGEAAARVGAEGRALAPELPWGSIVAARHVFVHVYWGIDLDRVWQTVRTDLPALIRSLHAALTDE